MKKNIIRAAIPFLCLLLLLPFIWGCTASQDEESAYFERLVKQAEARQGNLKAISTISRKELEKYHETGDDKFLIGSKYTDLYSIFAKYSTNQDEIVLRQLPLLYEILSINNGKYKYINIICNYGFSFSFEHNSPNLAMQFVDQGITEELKPGKQYFLPHLYHLKGRLYYNAKDYKNALIYFKKSLAALKKKDVLYAASMHNNFGMCYNKMGRYESALQEAEKAVSILKTIKNPSIAENEFYQSVNVNLGRYHYKLKNFSVAESIVAKEFEFYKDNPKFRNETATCSRYLFDIYKDTGQIYKMEAFWALSKTLNLI
ncbi:tetratricopeptide repeat protein [Chryseobacterium sp. L7]|uniref:Tetratricopeptide repeat protein n=1 Tax=Chryseobacterium endalhagicum TaxID=2797638 RepID=A0ABS1QG25_9FLAO|nr:tetratricopeptide repeat protein [Chryseobacterium endalhagicum]MBL1221536.1 tetratricopeptide repeat protein [Chryseobacterium endalhagicum]